MYRIFCESYDNFLKTFEDDLKKHSISGEEYNNKIKNFETEITTSLQNFITHMHCTVKLFYSTVIDYAPFQEEKDDLINMLITLFFKTGNLYESIYNLYNLAFSQQIQDLEDKLTLFQDKDKAFCARNNCRHICNIYCLCY